MANRFLQLNFNDLVLAMEFVLIICCEENGFIFFVLYFSSGGSYAYYSLQIQNAVLTKFSIEHSENKIITYFENKVGPGVL